MRKMTFAAVVVFLGLVGATVWTMRQQPNRGIAYVTLSDLTPDSADRIELTGAHSETLEKKGDAWYLGSGRLADPTMVNNLLKSAKHIQSSDLLTHDVSRYAEYEVDDAHGTGVRIMGGGHELAQLVAGRQMAGGMAMRHGGSAYKVTGVFPMAFIHNGNEWMERRLFLGTSADDVDRVEVALRGQPAYAVARGEGGWALAPGRDGRVADFRSDGEVAQRLVNDLVNVRADILLDTDPGVSVTGLNKAVDRLTLELKPKTPGDQAVRRTLILGATGDNKSLYAQVEGTQDIAIIPGYTGVILRKGRESMRDMRVTKGIDVAQVKALDLRRGNQRLALVRKDGSWSLPGRAAAASDAGLDATRVQRRVMDIVQARAASLAPGVKPQQAGISAREGEAKLTLDDNSTVAVVFGRQVAGDQVYMQGTADGQVYLVNAALRDHLLGMLPTLRTNPEGDPLARFDQDGIGNLPPDVRAGLSAHFAQKKREQQASQLRKGTQR